MLDFHIARYWHLVASQLCSGILESDVTFIDFYSLIDNVIALALLLKLNILRDFRLKNTHEL